MTHTSKIIFTLLLLLLAMPIAALSATTPCGTGAQGHCVVIDGVAAAGSPILEQLGITPGRTIGDIFVSLYQFGLGLVGVAALIMIVIGGVLYMTAGDSQNRLSQGKKIIGNAILGLALALLSWILLYTVNPDLVQRLELTLPGEVARQELLNIIPPGQEYNHVRDAVNSGAVTRDQVVTAVRTIGEVPAFRTRCAGSGGTEGSMNQPRGGSLWVCQRQSDPSATQNPSTRGYTCPAGSALYSGGGSRGPRCAGDFLYTNPNAARQ